MRQTYSKPKSAGECSQLVDQLDRPVDEVGEDENHPLASTMEETGSLIEKCGHDQVPELA